MRYVTLLILASIMICTTTYADVESVSDGVISGSGFGSKTTAAPLHYDNFEGGSNGNDVSGWDTYVGGGSVEPKYDNEDPREGELCLKHNFTDGSQYTCEIIENISPSTEELFVWWWHKSYYNDLTYYCSNQKLCRVEGDNGTKTGDQHAGVPLASYGRLYVADGLTRADMRAQYEPTSQADEFYPESIGWAHNEWHHSALYYNCDNDVTTNRELWIEEDFVDQSPSSETLDENWRPYMGNDSSKFDQVHMGYYFARNYNASESGYIYTDEVYIDTTRARVEVRNSATFNGATYSAIQPYLTAWSDTEISLSAWNQGSFSDYETAYLFVIDSNGDASDGYDGYFVDNVFYSADTVQSNVVGRSYGDGQSYGDGRAYSS